MGYLLAWGAYRNIALKVERISPDSETASFPAVRTKATVSPWLSGRIRLNEADPPHMH